MTTSSTIASLRCLSAAEQAPARESARLNVCSGASTCVQSDCLVAVPCPAAPLTTHESAEERSPAGPKCQVYSSRESRDLSGSLHGVEPSQAAIAHRTAKAAHALSLRRRRHTAVPATAPSGSGAVGAPHSTDAADAWRCDLRFQHRPTTHRRVTARSRGCSDCPRSERSRTHTCACHNEPAASRRPGTRGHNCAGRRVASLVHSADRSRGRGNARRSPQAAVRMGSAGQSERRERAGAGLHLVSQQLGRQCWTARGHAQRQFFVELEKLRISPLHLPTLLTASYGNTKERDNRVG